MRRGNHWVKWLALPAVQGWKRVKDHRHEALQPGARCTLTLFEQVEGGRPHPRLRVRVEPVVDAAPARQLLNADDAVDAASFGEAIQRCLQADPAWFAATDVGAEGERGLHFKRASVRGQRIHAYFAEAEAWLGTQDWPDDQRVSAAYRLREALDLAFSGESRFDDEDTGTYHSFQHDDPFVHYLEELLKRTPEPGTEAAELLPPEQIEPLRRQREQAQAHLDAIMRRKYAYDGVTERDIERSVGARLIDRQTRAVVTMQASEESLDPVPVLLRIAPDAEHRHAGAWVYRDAGKLRLQDGKKVRVKKELLRSISINPERLTFRRPASRDLLRGDIHLDWDGDGVVAAGPISWVDWAGHCDLKGIEEALGLTMVGEPQPTVLEYRSDTGEQGFWSRDELLEMLTSALEFGSYYQRFDGSGVMRRGLGLFGGARNDGLPDRLQFQGLGPGESFRWPVVRRRDALSLRSLSLNGEQVPLKRAFRRHEVQLDPPQIADNPRWKNKVDGDYNVIDVSGGVLTYDAEIHGFDASTGALTRDAKQLSLDLSGSGRQLLGTHLHRASRRELYRCWLDLDKPEVLIELERWTRDGDVWRPEPVPEETIRIPLVQPLTVTASRESKLDDPHAFQVLLEAAVRRGEGIVADTDMDAPVWNGVVVRIDSDRIAVDGEARTEHWRVDLKARFGDARLEYLLRRRADGSPEIWAPVDSQTGKSPDFVWQELPDVGSKGLERGDWVVNRSMVERGVVEVRDDRTVQGGKYVHDEHIKNVYELLWCGLSGHRYTLVHGNKRYAWTDREAWQAAVDQAKALRTDVLG